MPMLVMRSELWALAWSAPMQDLAGKIGITNVGLKRRLVAMGLPIPPQGYWNKVRAGMPVPRVPKCPPRWQGGAELVQVDHGLEALLSTVAVNPPPPGVTARPAPNGMPDVFRREMAAIGRAASARVMRRVDPAVQAVIEEDSQLMASHRYWSGPGPALRTPMGRRQLKILNAIFLTINNRSGSGSATIHRNRLEASICASAARVRLQFQIRGGTRWLEDVTLGTVGCAPASARLRLRSSGGGDWTDKSGNLLEDQIAPIVATLIGECEIAHLADVERRNGLAAAARLSRMRAAELERSAKLREAARLFSDATGVRTLATHVAQSVEAGSLAIDSETLALWLAWAGSEADALDPIISGQIFAHLSPPAID